MRVGLFLGSFDPIHIGHISIVTTVLNANLVDKVIIIPAWHNPFKEHNPAPFMKRWEMCYQSTKGITNVQCAQVEGVLHDRLQVDKFAMDYIFNKDICHITIYHMFNKPRNIPEANTRVILDLVDFRGGFKSDEERDSAMTRDSDFDIAFVKDCRWNSGTAQNIKRRYNI